MFQAESVRDAAFGCDWVGTPIPFQRCLMFIMATANKGFQLSAGKFVPVSNLTTTNVGIINILHYIFCVNRPWLPWLPSCWRSFLTLRHAALCRTSLDERSDRCMGIYLITHKTPKKQTFMTSAVFQPTIPAIELPLTQASDRATTGIYKYCILRIKMYWNFVQLISYNMKTSKYRARFEIHPDRFRMNKCL